MLTAREKFYIAAKKQKAKRKREARGKEHCYYAITQVPDGYLTLTQAVEKYNRAPSGLYKAISQGMIATIKIGPYRVIRESELIEYFNQADARRKNALYRGMKSRCKMD